MTARILIGAMLMVAILAGALMYYLQVYAFYEDVTGTPQDVQLVNLVTGQPEPVIHDNFRGIDSDSSPVRFRACFDIPLSLATLTETYQIAEAPEPLVAPGWFDCFDAGRIGADLASGTAIAFLGQPHVHYGIDRLVAVYPDGRAYAWHQINACGEVVFDGNPAPETCPPAPESLR